MRAVVQRVTRAEVRVEQRTVSTIEGGLLVLLGVMQGDTQQDAEWMTDKISGLRIFADDQGKMNRCVTDVAGSVLLVSQFTICGDARKGRRPAFTDAAAPAEADRLYQLCGELLRQRGIAVGTGIFAADMQVELVNDGPVTILLDSKKLF